MKAPLLSISEGSRLTGKARETIIRAARGLKFEKAPKNSKRYNANALLTSIYCGNQVVIDWEEDEAFRRGECGASNVAIGDSAFSGNAHGSFNTVVGNMAGATVEGDDNIYIGATSASGVTRESGTIRIGDLTFVSACYIAGINGQTATGGVPVGINGDGKLGTVTSSARFKDDVMLMDKASESILALKPVTFRYKKQIDANRTPQFGLVAEEVAKVNPDLVISGRDSKPYTVRYDAVNAMLLNEFLKEHKKVEALEGTVATLAATVREQAAQIQKVSAQLEVSSPAPQTVLNNQ